MRRSQLVSVLYGSVALIPVLVVVLFVIFVRGQGGASAEPVPTSWHAVRLYPSSTIAENGARTLKTIAPGDPATVLAWYGDALRGDGFTPVTSGAVPGADGKITLWQRGVELREVAIGPAPGRQFSALVVIGDTGR